MSLQWQNLSTLPEMNINNIHIDSTLRHFHLKKRNVLKFCHLSSKSRTSWTPAKTGSNRDPVFKFNIYEYIKIYKNINLYNIFQRTHCEFCVIFIKYFRDSSLGLPRKVIMISSAFILSRIRRDETNNYNPTCVPDITTAKHYITSKFNPLKGFQPLD